MKRIRVDRVYEAEDAARCASLNAGLENIRIRATDCGCDDFDDGISRLENLRLPAQSVIRAPLGFQGNNSSTTFGLGGGCLH